MYVVGKLMSVSRLLMVATKQLSGRWLLAM